MTKILENKKVIAILLAIIILVGVGIIATKGLNVGLEYSSKEKVEMILDQHFESEDVEKIAVEVLDTKNVLVKKVEVFEDTVAVYAKTISDDQKEKLIERINEAYGIELTETTVEETFEAKTRLRDVIKVYIIPILVTTLVVAIYHAIIFRKLGMVKIMLSSILFVVIAEAVLISIYAITRISVTPAIFAVGSLVYVGTVYVATLIFEQLLKMKK